MNLKKAPLSAKLGLAVILFFILVSVFAQWIAPFGEAELVGDVWESMSLTSWLGTDHLGRDLLTRMLYGAQNTISIALIVTVLSFTVGVIAGFSAATIGGWIDQLFSRIVDILMAFPTLIFALIVLSVLGTSVPVLIAVIALLDSTRVYRLSRAVAMDIEVMEYVEVARLRGEGLWWLMLREILPNAMVLLIAEFGLRFCFVFLFISALSFLGLGLQPPTADWGSMVRENAAGISFGVIVPLIPAGAIAMLTISVNLVVDWLLHTSSSHHSE